MHEIYIPRIKKKRNFKIFIASATVIRLVTLSKLKRTKAKIRALNSEGQAELKLKYVVICRIDIRKLCESKKKN